MNRLTKKRISDRKNKKTIFGFLLATTIAISLFAIKELYGSLGYISLYENILPLILFNLPLLIIYITLSIRKIKFNKDDEDIFIIILNFLNHMQLQEKDSLLHLENIFKKHPKEKLQILYNKHQKNKTPIFLSCKNLSKATPEIRYYALYSIFDIAANDKVLSIEEESFIKEISLLLRIHTNTYNYIKNSYLKQGLKEERKIIEEQNRKKASESFSKSFIPYSAYKILGITPSVTKAQLKKVYRTLAKQYHPDKFHGQSEEIIQQTEDKFQEITEAYEVIKKYKAFNI